MWLWVSRFPHPSHFQSSAAYVGSDFLFILTFVVKLLSLNFVLASVIKVVFSQNDNLYEDIDL
jgi:hypothetical protein